MEERPRPVTTTAAAILMILVCIPFLLNARELLDLAGNPTSADREIRDALILTGGSGGPREARTFALFGLAFTLGLSVLAMILAFGVWRRKQGAHHAAIIVFVLLALIALVSSVQGLTADPPAENAHIGFLVGLVNSAIVVLLFTNSSQDDFEYMESLRARRKYEKQDARAAAREARRAARSSGTDLGAG